MALLKGTLLRGSFSPRVPLILTPTCWAHGSNRFRGAALVLLFIISCYPKQSRSPCLAGDAHLPPLLHRVRTHSHCLATELLKSSVYIRFGWFCRLPRSVPGIRRSRSARASSRGHRPQISVASAPHPDNLSGSDLESRISIDTAFSQRFVCILAINEAAQPTVRSILSSSRECSKNACALAERLKSNCCWADITPPGVTSLPCRVPGLGRLYASWGDVNKAPVHVTSIACMIWNVLSSISIARWVSPVRCIDQAAAAFCCCCC